MKSTALVLLPAALLVSSTVRAQPVRDAQRPASGTATLSGTVVSDEPDPHPIRHARVVCASPDQRESVTAVTDDRGSFTCARLAAGRYTVNATRDGWIAAAYGARRPLHPGTAVPLGDGQRANVAIRMMRGAVITGTLLDESGQAATGATVVALRVWTTNGERRITATGSPGLADDRGVYRIYGLPPGDYYIGAGPSASALSVRQAQVVSAVDGRERNIAFASTYYPGTAIPLQAVPITVTPGEERADVDFALQIVTAARVEGTLMLPDGTPAPPAAQVSLVASGATAFSGLAFDGLKTTRPGSDGTFAFSGVVPGEYTLLARLAGPPVLWASSPITVSGDSVSGIALALQAALSIAGTVRIEGAGAKPRFGPTAVKVVAEPMQAAGDIAIAPSAAAVDADGRFLIRGVVPGRYQLVAALPASAKIQGWIQGAGMLGGTDTLDVAASIAQSRGDALVTLTDRSARLSGELQQARVDASPENTVVLFPADPALRLPRSRRIQAVRPDASGAFSFAGLVPGNYLLAVVEDVEAGEWQDPAFLSRLTPGAVPVTLAEGETHEVLRASAAVRR